MTSARLVWGPVLTPIQGQLVDFDTGQVTDLRLPPEEAICDVCHTEDGQWAPPLVGVVPMIEDVFIVTTVGPHSHTTGPPFGICDDCQRAMGIQPGQETLDLSRFKHRWLEVWRATCKKQGWPKALWAPENHKFYLTGG